MAWGQTLTGPGTLWVNGTAANDNILFAIEADDVVVLLNGSETRFALADVTQQILVRGFDGDDTIRNNTDIPMSATGGCGDDFIVGGTGDDELRGFCLLYTSPSPRDRTRSRMPSSA